MKYNYDKLFLKMKERGLNRGQLTSLAGISTNQMAHMGKGESIQLDAAVKICRVLNCSLNDIEVVIGKE